MARRDSSPSLPYHWSILRALDRLIAGEKHIRLLGASFPISPMRMRLKLDFICGGDNGHGCSGGSFPPAGLESILNPPYVQGLIFRLIMDGG